MKNKILYHRTKWDNAQQILSEGFRVKTEGHRIESGAGVYCVTSLEDANRPYNKKHYGNTIIAIEVSNDLLWEYGSKVEFMNRSKKGDKHGNRIYPSVTTGTVAVLYNIEAILSIKISRDNGKTWL
ncbi:MAG: hypothetical protein IJ504_00930 [Bacteroidales bacterium]|nr:hypothetical protein [Bacteroidales bacterium]